MSNLVQEFEEEQEEEEEDEQQYFQNTTLLSHSSNGSPNYPLELNGCDGSTRNTTTTSSKKKRNLPGNPGKKS